MKAVISVLNEVGASFVAHAGAMLVQAGILIVLIWGLDRFLRRRLRASLRYGLWMLVLVKLVLSPQFSLPTGIGSWAGHLSAGRGSLLPIHVASPPSGVSVKPQPGAAAREGTASPGTGTQPGAAGLHATASPGVPVQPEWPGAILALWLAGVSVLGAALLMRAVSVRRIVRCAEPPSESLRDLLARCRRDVGLAGSVELKLTRDLSGPALCRAWRPVILMPKALTDSLTEDKQRAILTHELCHIKRADPWVNLAQTLLQVFYFYNPLVWLANRSIRRVREQAVDERVLVCLRGQLQCYSHTLIDIASAMRLRPRLGMGLIGVSESKTHLNERIELMLHRPNPDNAGLGFAGLVTLVALGCALLPMAAAGGANVSTGAAFTSADAQTRDKVLRDIQTANDAFIEAFNNRHVEALMQSLTEDMIAMPPGEPAVVGAEALRKQYDRTIAEGMQIQGLKERDQQVWVCGDLIYTAGRYTLTVKMPDASTAAESRRGVAIWQRQKDGSLKLKLEAYNRADASQQPVDDSAAQVVLCPADSPTLPANAPLYKQIEGLDRKLERLFVDKKRADALDWYTDDATLMTLGYLFQGKHALKTAFEQEPNHHTMQDIEMKFTRIEGNEQMVYVVKWMGWKLKNPVSGMDYTIPGKSLHVWQRQADGSWKILLDLNNMDIMF